MFYSFDISLALHNKLFYSSFITDAEGNANQHLQYLPYGELFIDQRTSSYNARYKFNAKELDEETSFYYYGARYMMPEWSFWLSVDPKSDKYPSMSAYMYCGGNPVMLVDPNGEDIDPTAPGYEAAKQAATPKYDKKGKQINPLYEPKFEKLFNKLQDEHSINVNFINNMSESPKPDQGGTISYSGIDNGGINGSQRDIYNIYWDPSITKQLGTSAMFEETKHLVQGLSNEFDIKNNYEGFNIQHEVDAKIWVVENINNVKSSYKDENIYKMTHYGLIAKYTNKPSKIENMLLNGVNTLGRTLDNYGNKPYSVFGFGNYKK